MAMTTIEGLSDMTLLDIFDRLPLTDLLSTGLVCKLFYKFLRISCRTRHRLFLIVYPTQLSQANKDKCNLFGLDIPRLDVLQNDDGTPMFVHSPRQRQFHTLQITLSMEYVKFMVDLFPQIFELEILVKAESIKYMDALIYFLERCASKVTLLRIYLCYDTKFDDKLGKNIRPHVRLLSVFKSMPALRRLKLQVNISLVKNRYARINLPILGQLEQFVLQSDDFFDSSLGSFKRFAVPNENLNKILMKNLIKDPAVLLQFEPEFAARFSQIYLAVRTLENNQMSTIFDRFRNLTSLSLCFLTSINRDALYRSLRPLTQLVYLLLNVFGHEMIRFTFDPFEDALMADDEHSRLPSVKVITYIIHGVIESHRIFASFRLGHIFPNLQVVELRFQDLSMCRKCKRNNNIDPSKWDSACLLPMLRTLRQKLPKLKRILTNGNEYII